MEYEENEWMIHGVNWDDPKCLHTPEEVVAYVNKVGFLPLFKNELPGFSLEERSVGDGWWSGDEGRDPWQWRTVLASGREVVYGKFFGKRAGFISKEFFPYFVNYRRDGYDFDTLFEDGKASSRQKKIMDLFLTNEELFSFEVKKQAGFFKGGEKNFEGTLQELQTKTYLCMSDFRQKTGKNGQPYGWQVVIFSTPENLFGYSYVTSAYKEEPSVSKERIISKLREQYPQVTEKQIKCLI